MKKTFLIIAFSLYVFISFGAISCRIDFSVKGLENKSLIFGYEYGNKELFIDTIKLDNEGKGLYQSAKRLPGGIYLVVFPGKKYVEILINEEQFFTVNTDTTRLFDNLIIEGSEESQLFIQYLALCNKSKTDTSYSKHIKDFKSKVFNKYSQSFLNQYLKMNDISANQKLTGAENIKPGKDYFIKRYNLIKTHYFDNVSFNDTRLLRTRLLYDKLDYYINTFTSQNYDSLVSSINQLISLAKVNDESYHFVLGFLFDNYKIPKNDLKERLLIYIADNYYLGGKAPWADKKFLKILENRVNELRPTAESSKAPNLELKTVDDKKISLYDIRAKFTILLFWSPDCNICVNELSKLNELDKKFNNSGLEIFAVYTHADKEVWTSFVKKNKLSWVHAYDPMSTNYTKLYNVKTLPKVFLLDSEKRIILKDTNAEKIEKFLENK